MSQMDPGLIAFLPGVGIGFIEDEYIVCQHCGCEFLEEDLRYVDDNYTCPACFRLLDEGGSSSSM